MNPKILVEGGKLIAELSPVLKEQWTKVWAWLKEEAKKQDWEKLFDELKQLAKEKVQETVKEALTGGMPENVNVVCVEKEALRKEDLVQIARENIVADSNQVLAAINTTEQSAYYVYLAYARDREMIPQEQNTYVIIKAEALAKDVEALFGGNELIILK